MKSAEKRVNEAIEKAGFSKNDPMKEIIAGIMLLAMKEQDKITRYACAENVMNMSFCDAEMTEQEQIDANKAFSVIMNTKAV